MRILFVAPRFHTNQYQVIKTLQEKKHDVSFHVASIGFTEDHSLLKPIRYDQCKASHFIEKIFGTGGVNRPNYFPNPFRYWKIFKELKPEIAIIRDPYKFFSLLAAICSLFAKTKIVFYTQENLFSLKSKKKRFKLLLTMRFFNAAWMSPINDGENKVSNQIKNMYYVPLPIAIKPFNGARAMSLQKELKILMIGKYHQSRKNHFLFIKAISILKDKYKFKVTIVGECIRDQQLEKFNLLKETIQNLGLSEIVDLKKNVPFAKMEELYTTHHIFVLPARSEQYGISVTEALGYGLPAICTDTCGARFNIRNGENGFVVKSDSLPELTEAIETLLSNKEKLFYMSENSLSYVQANLSGAAFYNRFKCLLTESFRIPHLD